MAAEGSKENPFKTGPFLNVKSVNWAPTVFWIIGSVNVYSLPNGSPGAATMVWRVELGGVVVEEGSRTKRIGHDRNYEDNYEYECTDVFALARQRRITKRPLILTISAYAFGSVEMAKAKYQAEADVKVGREWEGRLLTYGTAPTERCTLRYVFDPKRKDLKFDAA